jgi:hypothetical protein
MIMADGDMKQKIKEVRDKFLSNNQIADIRQNITLGVEERLKFLNSEQIKVVELLEEKHQELDFALQTQTRKIDEARQAVETTFENKITTVLTQHEQQSTKLERQSEDFISKQTELEKRLDKKFKDALEGQLAFMDDRLAQFSTEYAEFREHLKSVAKDFSKKVDENGAQFSVLSDKSLSEVESNRVTLLKKLEEKVNEVVDTVDQKLSIFEEDKKDFLHQTTQNFSVIVSNLEKKIESFLKNHKTVEEVVDSRLNEFRTAQKAAFEELEAALNLLEKHQDDTLTRFRQRSDLTNTQNQNRQSNLPNSLIRNRGSILYQSENISESALPLVEEAIETTATETQKNSSKKILKPIIFALMGSIILLSVMGYFNINYSDFINLSSSFIE